MWFLPVVTDTVDKVKISAGTVKENVSSCTVSGEGERKYLSGNLWCQEIETPCCKDLKKKKGVKQI